MEEGLYGNTKITNKNSVIIFLFKHEGHKGIHEVTLRKYGNK